MIKITTYDGQLWINPISISSVQSLINTSDTELVTLDGRIFTVKEDCIYLSEQISSFLNRIVKLAN